MTKPLWTDLDADDPDPLAGREALYRARHERIIQRATALFAASGPERLDMAGLAHAIGVSLPVLSVHFTGVEDVLAQTLAYYLRGLVPVVLAAGAGAPARRCFLENTRTAAGGHTSGHGVWLRHKRFLPKQLRLQLEQYYQQLGPCLAWPDGDSAVGQCVLRFLDQPRLPAAVMERACARSAADRPAEAAPKPAMAPAEQAPEAAPRPAISPAEQAFAELRRRRSGGARAEYYENLLRAHRGTLHAPSR